VQFVARFLQRMDLREPDLEDKSRLSLTYGARYVLLADVTGGVSFYCDPMFTLDERVLRNTTHCAFNHIGRVVEV
jgi:hypothetical protein